MGKTEVRFGCGELDESMLWDGVGLGMGGWVGIRR